MQLTLADGQLAASATAILTGSTSSPTVNVVLQNTSASTTETVVLTFQRSGGTSRRLVRQVLAPNEQLIVSGITLMPDDTLLGQTTNASTVDYLAFSGGGAFNIQAFDSSGLPKSSVSTSYSSALGYSTGAGGAVTQGTNRSTGVTLSKLTGAITTHTTSLAAGANAAFTVTNSLVAATDTVLVSLKSGNTGVGTCVPFVSAVGAGSFEITISNQHASTAETGACVLNFAVIKAVAA